MLHLLLMTLTSAQAQLQEKQQPVCDTNLNLCCGSTLGQKSCAVVVSLICLDLVNVTSVDGVTGSQDVHDVLRLRCRTLQSKHNCRQHNAAAVIKWPPSIVMHCNSLNGGTVSNARQARHRSRKKIHGHRRSAGAREHATTD